MGQKQSSSLFRVKIFSVLQIKRKQSSLPLPPSTNGECLHSDSSASSTKKHCSTGNVELRRSTSTNYRSKVEQSGHSQWTLEILIKCLYVNWKKEVRDRTTKSAKLFLVCEFQPSKTGSIRTTRVLTAIELLIQSSPSLTWML